MVDEIKIMKIRDSYKNEYIRGIFVRAGKSNITKSKHYTFNKL